MDTRDQDLEERRDREWEAQSVDLEFEEEVEEEQRERELVRVRRRPSLDPSVRRGQARRRSLKGLREGELSEGGMRPGIGLCQANSSRPWALHEVHPHQR